jgi:Calcipressin
MLDGEVIMGCVVRVFFGEPTTIGPVDQHLSLPDAGKLFFISPPPSPPHGWTMKLEEPPNKEVHAEDLAEALEKLRARPLPEASEGGAYTAADAAREGKGEMYRQRSGSWSMRIFEPEADENGNSPNLPAIAVEDTSQSPEELSPLEPSFREQKPIMAHTSRPPVELMHDA